MRTTNLPGGDKRETRALALDNLELRAGDGDDKAPTIVGHAAVFDQLSEDLGGFREKIAPGAFAETIKNDDIRALYNHEPDHVLGRNRAGTLRLREDKTGLHVSIDPPDTPTARALLVSIGRGDISQMSFGFYTEVDEWDRTDDDSMIRTLKQVRVFDVSPVTFPAYPQTDVAVRSMNQIRESDAEALRRAIDFRNRRRRITLAQSAL